MNIESITDITSISNYKRDVLIIFPDEPRLLSVPISFHLFKQKPFKIMGSSTD
jgi:hypothetical protein